MSYFTDIDAFYREVNRVLKPGGTVIFEDYVQGPGYDSTDPRQKRLMAAAKPVLGGVIELKPAQLRIAVEGAGFEIQTSRDESNPNSWPLMQQSV